MKPLVFLRWSFLLLSLASSCTDKGGYAEEVPAWIASKSARAVDGDTLMIDTTKIRLRHVDCPELKQPFGPEAKAFTEKLCKGANVQCQVVRDAKKFDRYGRYLAEVRVNGRWLADELVKHGLAAVDPRYTPKDDPLFDMQDEAKADKRGMWSLESVVMPWDYRKGKR
jgi:endonuclease YncB( thermonuclease family)